jgi:hypothetical protein
MEEKSSGLEADHVLNDGEEIVGIYGGFCGSGNTERIGSLGFIVWIPPKF